MTDLQHKFSSRVKELRKQRGLTQEQLAEKIGIGVRSLVKIETANSFPSTENLEKLIYVLNTTPSEFFDFEHLQPQEDLRQLVIKLIDSHPEKITDIYKVVKALTD